MVIRLLIQQNYLTIIIVLFTIIFIVTNHSFEKSITQLFLITVSFILVLVIVDSIELWAASWSYPSFTRNIMLACGYSLRPAIAFGIILILRRDTEKSNFLLLIPLLINTLLAFVSCFSKIMFYFTEQNVFVRGPLGYVPFLVSGIYIIIMLICTIQKYKDDNWPETIIAFAIAIISVVATILEAAFEFEGFLNATCAVSVIFYYLYLHTQQFKRDTLTHALNRRCFYVDAKKLTNMPFAVASIDLNNLKRINDTEGHAAGDKAICTVVCCIRKQLINGCTLYRTGGDEFMLLCAKQSRESIEGVLQKINQEIRKTPYSCAIGIAYYEVGDDFETVCAEADAMMYKNKRTMKAEMEGSSRQTVVLYQ